ncbi:unnamed protein product [marine sediment metagenome]|uniref:Uncharacterized protein n=1 Tax=marine sediment metagenome TaxID=412755 RepID=X1GQR1_9ZZZZ
MPCWNDLFEMLLDEDLSAEDIVSRLAVKPSRMRQLLNSKRLDARLKAVESVANQKAGHAVLSTIDSAAKKLAVLTANEKPETARRACLDVIKKAEQIYRDQGLGTRD